MYKVLWFLENVWPNRCAKYITKISDSICIYLHLLFKNSNPFSILSSTSLGFQQNGVNLKNLSLEASKQTYQYVTLFGSAGESL